MVSMAGIVGFILLVAFAEAVEHRDVFSKPTESYEKCIDSLPPYKVLDHHWANYYNTHSNENKWYVVTKSQRMAQRQFSMFLSGAAGDACLINNPCLGFHGTADPFSWKIWVCNNRSLDISYVPVPNFGNNATYKMGDGSIAWTSTWREIMSDGQSYILFYECWEDGLKGFSVHSIKRGLTPEVEKTIRERLDADGFSKFERIRTFVDDLCPA